MNQVACILNNAAIYWYPVVLALAICAGGCMFMACCLHIGIQAASAAEALLLSALLSAFLGRLLYWNCRADSFDSLFQALTTPAASCFALSGAFVGCPLAACCICRSRKDLPKMLDCMSVSGCAAIALGRLGNFFTNSDRGQVVMEMTGLPWVYPVMNSASGLPEYRLATFLFQSLLAAVLFLILAILFFRNRKRRHGDLTALFLLIYSASQILLDSTRYDSLYLRSNGFVSMVQVLAAIALLGAIVYFAVRSVKVAGMRKSIIPIWVAIAVLFSCAGYMEYYVQRHGRLALFSYTVMGLCLLGIVLLTLFSSKST